MYLWICDYVFQFLKKFSKQFWNIFTNIKNSDDHNLILVQNLGKKIQPCLNDQIFQTFAIQILFGIFGIVSA